MLLTTTTLILFLLVAVAALAVGIFSERNEVYVFGLVFILFMGLWVMQSGISQAVGEQRNATVTNDTTVTSLTYEYETTSTIWTSGFGLLLIVTAAGLFLHFYRAGKEKKQRDADSIDVD
jgi:O-antigen/teichoic acid export membrane protein